MNCEVRYFIIHNSQFIISFQAMSNQIIIIGGGPAGIEAARAAAKNGADTTIISNSPLGGRAGWHSLMPSKVWLTAADALGLFREGKLLGLAGEDPTAWPDGVMQRIKSVKGVWSGQQMEALQALGVKIVTGTAVFQSPTAILVKKGEDDPGETMTADAFIVATGSVPIFPPTMKPNGKTVIAPRFASGLNALPKSMVVVGGGATGSEFAYLFNRMDVDMTWVVDQFGVLPGIDPDASRFLKETLAARGVKLVEGQMARRIDQTDGGIAVVLEDGARCEAEMAFLAIGRKPDTAGLNLEAAGLTLERGTAPVDEYGRSAQPHIYLAGDATGDPMIANRAMAQAWVAGQHAAGQTPPPFAPETVISAVYTEPQIAQVGRLTGDDVRIHTTDYGAGAKTHLLPAGAGFVKLAYEGENGRIVGAAAIGPHAGDVLAPIAVAIQVGMTAQELGRIYGAHPTLSELAFTAARQAWH